VTWSHPVSNPPSLRKYKSS